MGFSTKEVAAYYGFAEQTIRKWTIEFEEYLSPTANPGNGKNRDFTVADLEVIDLIAEHKKRQDTYESIHLSLKSGQRGKAPDLTDRDLQVLAATEGEKKASLEIATLQRTIIDLTERLNRAEEKAAAVHQVEKENTRLETKLGMTETELTSTRDALKEAQARIEVLIREAGEQYTKGVMDTLERVGQLSPRPGASSGDENSHGHEKTGD